MNNPFMKLYTLSKPPSQEEPYLHPVWHNKVIKHFENNGNSCHIVNSEGEVDFYFLLPLDDLEGYLDKTEEIGLNLRKSQKVEIEIYYDEENLTGIYIFDLEQPMDYHSLKVLTQKKYVNLYFINAMEDYYLCSGYHTVYLPAALCYNLERFLAWKEPFTLPQFNEENINDQIFDEELLLKKSWGFYLDYTTLVERIGSVEEAEEIISLHLLHSMATLQRSRRLKVREDLLILWIGRKVSVNKKAVPREYYNIYLSGANLTGEKKKDHAQIILEEIFSELPEFIQSEWVDPLAEESIPLTVITNNNLYRIDLTNSFYHTCDYLFKKYFLPDDNYQSYYHKFLISQMNNRLNTKIYNLVEKRKEKNNLISKNVFRELLNLIEQGQEECLPKIFDNLDQVPAKEVDELIVCLCEKYHKKAEPYLLNLVQASQYHLKAAAILGLGILESKQAVGIMIQLLQGSKEEASLAKFALASIGDSAFFDILPLLQHQKAEIRLRVIETLGLWGTPHALSFLKGLKTDRSKKVEEAKKKILLEFDM